MNLKIAARNCKISDALRKRTETRVARLTKFHPRVTAAEIVFSEVKRTRGVEVILSLDADDPVVARAEGEEFRTALDKVLDRLVRILGRRRDARTDHQARSRSDGVPSGAIE